MSESSAARQRIVLAEDCPSVRRSVRALLEREQFEVVGEAGDGVEAVHLTAALQPDVVVLDRAMPNADGFQAAVEISRLAGRPHMILLTIHIAPHHVTRGVAVGIRGFVTKQDAPEDLVRAVHEVTLGRTFLSARVWQACPGIPLGSPS
jgi:DNA-binding NarL/FixJ family response regulator